jgi:hypothetical protein
VSRKLISRNNSSLNRLAAQKSDIESVIKEIQPKFAKVKQECLDSSAREHNALS